MGIVRLAQCEQCGESKEVDGLTFDAPNNWFILGKPLDKGHTFREKLCFCSVNCVVDSLRDQYQDPEVGHW